MLTVSNCDIFFFSSRRRHTRSLCDWSSDVCSSDLVLLKDLEITEKYMLRVMGKSEDRRLKTPAFHAQANLLTAGILSQQRAFFDSVRKLHDRSGQAQSGVSAAPGRHEHRGDRSPVPAQPQHGAHDPQAKGGDAGPAPQAQGSH